MRLGIHYTRQHRPKIQWLDEIQTNRESNSQLPSDAANSRICALRFKKETTAIDA